MDNEALGKILGMAMAYGVSFIGLVLAYYNYRKRIAKAEGIFTGTALAVFVPSALLVAGVLVFTVWFALNLPEEGTKVLMSAKLPAIQSTITSNKLIGILVPGAIFVFSFWVTYMLYKHFSKQIEEGEIEIPPEGPADAN